MKEKTVVTKLPAGEIVEIKKLADGTFEVTQKVLVEEKATPKKSSNETIWVEIEAEALSMDDEFMKYEPRTDSEGRTKARIAMAIGAHVKNFYRPIMDPYFTANGIGYEAGKNPAVGKSYNWWSKTAKEFAPDCNSRLGTKLEYVAFLGVLIKKLVEEGKSVEWAWNAVCNDSKELGHYWNSENAKHDFELTGSRCICGFYDLANTFKILAEDEEAGDFMHMGGRYYDNSCSSPVAHIDHSHYCSLNLLFSVGWLVIPA